MHAPADMIMIQVMIPFLSMCAADRRANQTVIPVVIVIMEVFLEQLKHVSS